MRHRYSSYFQFVQSKTLLCTQKKDSKDLKFEVLEIYILSKMFRVLIVVSAALNLGVSEKSWAIVGNPIAFFHPCEGTDALVLLFEQGLPPGEENQYKLHIREKFVPHSKIYIKFDTDAIVTLEGNLTARISAESEKNLFLIHFYKPAEVVFLDVKGPSSGSVPYVESVEINTVEYCDQPKKGYLDQYIIGVRDTAELLGALNPDDGCGRRRVQHTELIVNGSPTKPGDWPWHVAIYRFEWSRIDYICGGTLLSQYFVVTAAHCVSNKGLVVLPETRNVVLGKYNLVGGDIASQEKEVHKIVIHEGFDAKTVAKDIALMKFKTAAEFSNYIQPACLWYSDAAKMLPQKHGAKMIGTVVGWGFDHTDNLSPTLQQVSLPEMSDVTCIKSNPVFFSQKLDGSVFCGGYANGTSVCNGDSGGGFHVFVPDQKGNEAHDATGAWHVRGIVSLSVKRRDAPVCDPESYSLFTDLTQFTGWIKRQMEE